MLHYIYRLDVEPATKRKQNMSNKSFTMFDVEDEEVVVSRNPENADYTNPRGERHGLVYFVTATNEYGDRLQHNRSFRSESEAVALRTKVWQHVVAGGKLDGKCWNPGRAVYGSDAYIAYGQGDDLAWERRCDQDETLGLR